MIDAAAGRKVPDDVKAALEAAMREFGIASKYAQAGFLGNCAHESAGFSQVVENLNYSADALIAYFSRNRISAADAYKFGRGPNQAADQRAIANLIYGGAWGANNLGNTEPGDGWRFRGRGYIQTTGRANYLKTGGGLGLDLIAKPELLELPVNAARSAAQFWHSRGCTALAESQQWERLTRQINGGMNGHQDRMQRIQRALQ